MTQAAIETHGLGKRYLLGEDFGYRTIREAIATALPRRQPRSSQRRELWALRDVDLTIAEGEAVGIVGRNGAGKSTLLKLLSRITEPTVGVARMRGRVGALLEVGTGFHPELTGRENVFLNGTLLGMSRREVRSQFDEIVEFAGVGEFLDTPLKRYSTGMRLRLAFAVAAHLEPPIVIVDEVLAVGDLDFQRKCLEKMSQIAEHGRTVVFVSHDTGAIARLCSRAIWLEQGRVEQDGPVQDVVEAYVASQVEHRGEARFEPASAAVQLRAAALLDADGRPTGAPRRDEPFWLRIELAIAEPTPGLDISTYIRDRHGQRIVDERWSDTHAEPLTAEAGAYRVTVRFPPMLPVGEYSAGIWLGSEHETWEYRDVLAFATTPCPSDRDEAIRRPRAAQPALDWSRVHDSPAAS